MKKIAMCSLVLLQYSCGILPCIDSQFERDTELLPEKHEVILQLKNSKPIEYIFQCEKYYDAMCATRGNKWAVRQVGHKQRYQPGHINFNHTLYGDISISTPTCTSLLNKESHGLRVISIQYNNHTYMYNKSIGDVHQFKPIDFKRPVKYSEFINLEFKMYVNNVLQK